MIWVDGQVLEKLLMADEETQQKLLDDMNRLPARLPADAHAVETPPRTERASGFGSAFLYVMVTVMLAVISAGVAYLYAKWEDYKASQSVSVGETSLSMPAEMELSIKDRKTFTMETPGEYGEVVPLEEGLEAVRTGPKAWLLIPTQTGTFRLLGYTAVRNRPTPYQITTVKVRNAGAVVKDKGTNP